VSFYVVHPEDLSLCVLSSHSPHRHHAPILCRSLICSAINAVSMALMDAGIMTTDMVTSCSAGVLRHGTCQDLNQVSCHDCIAKRIFFS
jgi:hypothetical protein